MARNEDNSIKELLQKTNHPLLDIRCRSLRSITFKLTNGLLKPSDLAHEREFLAHLLEWFNFEEWALESQVLNLLNQLSEQEAAASTLVEIGGVEFLSQLRLHCDPSLHPLIDEILEHLLKLPHPLLPVQDHTLSTTTPITSGTVATSTGDSATDNPRLNSTFMSEYTADMGSYRHSDSSATNPSSASSAHTSSPFQTASSHNILQSSESSTTPSLPTQHRLSGSSSSTEVSSWTSLASGQETERVGGVSFPYSVSTVIPQAPRRWGSGEEAGLRGPEGGEGGMEELRCDSETKLSIGHFPWLRLTNNDNHILTTTQRRLENPTPESLLRSCEFLQDVLFQDFPAELFLQRPALINGLLQLLVSSDIGPTHYSCLLCLLTFARKLLLRVKLRDSPSSIITSYPNLITESNLSVPHPTKTTTAGGDKQDGLEYLSADMLHQLQANQLSVRHFCSTLMTFTTPLLQAYLDRDFPWMRSVNEQGQPHMSVAMHVHACLQLLACGVELMVCESEAGQQDKAKLRPLQLCVTTLCSLLTQCQSKWRRLSTQGASPRLQLVCCVTLDLAQYLSRLLSLSGCGWKEEGCEECVVPALVGVLQGFMMGGVVGVVCPHLQSGLLKVFSQVDPPTSRLYNKVRIFSESFEWLALFLSYTGATPTATPPGAAELMEQASRALPALWFYCEEQFITRTAQLCLNSLTARADESLDGEEGGHAKELLMKLLCHGAQQAQQTAYRCFIGYVRTSLPSSTAPLHSSSPQKPPTTTTPPEVFHGAPSDSPLLPPTQRGAHQALLDRDIVQVLVTRGAVCRCEAVAAGCLELLADLFSLRGEDVWPQVRKVLSPVLPYIEVCVMECERLLQEFQEVLTTPITDYSLSPLSQLCSLLRLLFSESSQIRQWSYSQLVELLSPGDERLIAGSCSLSHHDVLVTGNSQKDVLHSKRSGAFKQEDALKLIGIVKSETVNMSLRKSALEQLVILLRDDCLHARVLEEGLLDLLTSTLSSALIHLEHTAQSQPEIAREGSAVVDSSGIEGREMVELLYPCLGCLLDLAVFSVNVRRVLATQQHFLTSLLKVAVLKMTDPEYLYAVSKLLAVLLFAEEVRVSEDGAIILPTPLKERLTLPFQAGGYDLPCNYLTPSPLEPSTIVSEPLLSMLRMQYLSRLFKDFTSNSDSCEGLDEKLEVPSNDLASLKCLNFRKSLSESFEQLLSASSHSKVMDLLHHVSVLVHTVHCVGGEGRRGLSYPDAVGSLWINVAERFLKVSPSTAQDHTLLEAILSFLCDLLSLPDDADSAVLVGRDQLAWLCEASLSADSVLTQLFQASLQQGRNGPEEQSKRSLQKAILKYFAALLRRLTSEPSGVTFDLTSVLVTLSHCLDIAGSTMYYDIPLLELSLDCVLHFTDRKLFGGVSSRSILGLAMKLMTLLRQVLWSFMSGQGKMVESYMGKGVISRGSLAISHLMHSIETQLHPPQEWWRRWLQSSEVELVWLQLLVEDRDPSVRYAGLSLLSFLCSKPGPAEVLLGSWGALHPLSIWGVCVKVALELRECSIIRKQALLVLAGLSAVCSTVNKWDQYLSYSSQQVTLKGDKALDIMLDSYKFLTTLQYSIKSETITQTSTQLVPLLCKILPDRQVLQVFVPLGQFTSAWPELRESGVRSEGGSGGLALCGDNGAADELKAVLCDVYVACDPHVVTGLCVLLYNLFRAFPELVAKKCHHSATLVQLTSLLDSVVAGAFLMAGRKSIISEFLHQSWTTMLCKILTLFALILTLKPDSILPYVLRENVVESVSRILAQTHFMLHSAADPNEDCSSLGALSLALASFLCALVGVAPTLAGRELVLSSLQLHWETLTGLLLLSLASQPSPPSPTTLQLRQSCLKLLSQLLLHRFRPSRAARGEGKRGVPEEIGRDPSQAALMKALEHLLDGDESSTDYKVSQCCGALLAEALLKVRDCALQVNSEGWCAVNNTLSVLLTCSKSAKHVALQGGLLQSSLEQLKTLHAKLCAETLDQPLRKKKESAATIQEIVTVVSMLRNFMYQSHLVKTACQKRSLATILHKLWPTCTVNKQLLLAILYLLIAYTAHDPAGRASLAASSKGSSCLLQDILKLTSHTLSCHRSCSSAKMNNPHVETLGLLFTLLANSALSQECRAIIKKTNFVAGFSQVLPKQEKVAPGSTSSGGHTERTSSMWVRLLANLSFFGEGQTTIIKTPGMLEVLLDVYECGHVDSQTLCLLIWRNLAFHPHSRTILTNNKNILNGLMTALDSNDGLRVTLAVSALWSLLHNNSKARNSLKKTSLFEKLQNLSLSAVNNLPAGLEPTGFLSREKCAELKQQATTQVMRLLQC